MSQASVIPLVPRDGDTQGTSCRDAGAAAARGEIIVRRHREAVATAAALRARLTEARLTHRHQESELRRRLLEADEHIAALRSLQRQLRDECAPRARALAPGRRLRPVPESRERLVGLHAAYAASRDPRLRGELLRAYDGYALGLARKFPSRRESPEDLGQVARIGLLHAIDRFDPSLGRPFTTFARATILGELKRHVRDRTWSMRVPRSLQEQYLVVVRAVDDLTQELSRSPSIREVARRAGMSEEDVLEAMELGGAQRPLSLDLPVGDGDGRALDPGSEDGSLGRVENRALLEALMARLPERERHILQLRFVEEMTQAEIAARIGVSQMYISRLLTRTLGRMRAWARPG